MQIIAILTHHYGGTQTLSDYLANHPGVRFLGEPVNDASWKEFTDFLKTVKEEKKTIVFRLMYTQMNPEIEKYLKDNGIKVVQVHGHELSTDNPYIDKTFIKKVEAWKNSYKHLADYTLDYEDYKPSKDRKWRNHYSRKPFMEFVGVEDKMLELA